jgi:hypothetical protein
MDFTRNAKPNRIANGNSTLHACIHHTVQTVLVDA